MSNLDLLLGINDDLKNADKYKAHPAVATAILDLAAEKSALITAQIADLRKALSIPCTETEAA